MLRQHKMPEHPAKVQTSRSLDRSILDSWLWVNLKGVVAALPNVHDPDSDIIGAHFDLKPANILVDELGNLVLTDYGLIRMKLRARNGHSSLTTPGGDFNYRPPPPIPTNRWSRKYDIWSLGCIMIEIIIYLRRGKDAVNEFAKDLEEDDSVETRSQTFWKKDQGRYILKKSVKHLLDQDLQDPRDPYLKQIARLLQQMLNIDPNLRPTVKTVLDALDGQNLFPVSVSKSGGIVQVCGANTKHPLKNM